MITAPDATENLLRYFIARYGFGGCHTPQDFTAGFDLSGDLTATSDGFQILGGYPEFSGESTGSSVHAAGDVNGDGFDDVIIGAPDHKTYFNPSTFQTGQAYVIFGGDSPGNVDLTSDLAVSGTGFGIEYYINALAYLGGVVRGIGDINGDGFDDVIVGATNNSGQAFVVFGSADPVNLDVGGLTGSNGFKIYSSSGATGMGGQHTMDGAGDFNGDGVDDFVIGTQSLFLTGALSGGAIVLYGKAAGDPFSNIDITTYSFYSGSEGIQIVGTGSNEGKAVSSAGDFNGDGLMDVAIGAPTSYANFGGGFIVFGQKGTQTTDISLNTILGGDNTNGIAINGNTPDRNFGNSVSSVGDINGDGFDDVIFGYAYGYDKGIVIYGSASPTNINLSTLTSSDGFTVTFTRSGDTASFGNYESLGGPIDINGDTYPDLLVGQPGFDDLSGPFYYDSGAVGFVFGSGSGIGDVDLYGLSSTQGFTVEYAIGNDSRLGRSVSYAGDINGDGCDDAIVGAPSVTRDGYTWVGASWVIFGGVQQ